MNTQAERDVVFHFCQHVTLQEVIIIPAHQAIPAVAYQLQYKNAAGEWRASGALGVSKAGYGLRRNSNEEALLGLRPDGMLFECVEDPRCSGHCRAEPLQLVR